jgi:precorrin-2/cobalt-factor-2 C20-methyltransferase
MTAGTLYGLGVGPGDPELVTVKAVKVLQSVDLVLAASSTKNDYSLALSIVRQYIQDGVVVQPVQFPMTRQKRALSDAWQANARRILDLLKAGKKAAFVTLGDPLTYSTYGYMVKTLKELDPDCKIVTVPGITAYNAAAARVNLPLVEGPQSLLVISGVGDQDKVRELLHCSENVVILKTYREFDMICQTLEDLGAADRAVLVSRLGHEDETVEYDIRKLKGKPLPYLSLLIVKNNGLPD